jgi:membrane protein YdbS with pleckstrin-like domain
MVNQQIDRRVISMWRVQGVIVSLLFWAPVAAGVGYWFVMNGALLLGVVLAAAIFFGKLTLSLVWPTLIWSHFSYSLRESDLTVKRGVLFRRISTIPYSRIQHVDTHQGPLEQLFGLGQLHLFTASGMSADGTIPGLDFELAEKLRDVLADKAGLDRGSEDSGDGV